MFNTETDIIYSINYILLLGKWYINSSKTNKKGIFLYDFIDLLKEKLDCIKLTCTLNDTDGVFSKCFGTIYEKLCSQ